MEPLLVATDGGRSAASALEWAAAYSATRGVPVEVVSVVEPLSDLPMPLPHRDELEEAHARGVAERVRQHVRDSVGVVSWPVHVRLGRPAPAICTTARAVSARMVVLGVDPKHPDGNATAVELLHLAEKPVLVARGGSLPRTAVVGVDFRPSSLRAAHEVVQLMGGTGTIHLVHIQPSLDFPAAAVWGWEPCYKTAVDSAFERVADELRGSGAGEVVHHRRQGPPAEELMAATHELDADLVAIGSDGYICNGRVVVGRVARRVLAESPAAVLATPVVTVAVEESEAEAGAPIRSTGRQPVTIG
jgi:nucleotide-binding universal stress UspA family protein